MIRKGKSIAKFLFWSGHPFVLNGKLGTLNRTVAHVKKEVSMHQRRQYNQQAVHSYDAIVIMNTCDVMQSNLKHLLTLGILKHFYFSYLVWSTNFDNNTGHSRLVANLIKILQIQSQKQVNLQSGYSRVTIYYRSALIRLATQVVCLCISMPPNSIFQIKYENIFRNIFIGGLMTNDLPLARGLK